MIIPTPKILALTALTAPAAIVLSTNLLLTQTLVGALDTPGKETQATIQLRATKLTMILKNIEGYPHGGIND